LGRLNYFLLEDFMGGHSHWAGIKHKKAIVDAKRGKVWTKISREITIAAKMGGGDISGNPRLRKAIDDARASNMPSDNIKRAIQKGTGEIPGAVYEELTYEGYGPGGIAILVEVTTDNRNRTGGDIGTVFTKNGGNKGEAGCVSWMFKPQGLIRIKKSSVKNEDALISHALEANAEDVLTEDAEFFDVITSPVLLEKAKESLAKQGYEIESASAIMKPDNTITLDEATAAKVLALIDALEENDDVKNVHANFDIPDDILSKLEKW
jgi:YebC/PmpR family DNA-binding regulatory protein